MNLLAIDTTGAVCGVAVSSDGRIACELNINCGLTHSETLLPAIDAALSYARVSKAELDGVAVCTGPGSFTGVRIGVCTAKGLAHALCIPIIEIDALDALAANVSAYEETVCALMDARNECVYAALYKSGKKLTSDRAVPIAELLDELDGRKVVFVGDGAISMRQVIEKSDCIPSFADSALILQRAASVCSLGEKKLLAGDTASYDAVMPFYLRESQAERLKKAKER